MSKAAIKLVFADACYSGSIKNEIPKTTTGPTKDKEDGNISPGSGILKEVAIMLSSNKNQTSREFSGINQGVFSHFLIDGLKGAADKNSDNTISIAELYYYVRDNTYDFVRKYSKSRGSQTPILFGNFDRDMVIAAY